MSVKDKKHIYDPFYTNKFKTKIKVIFPITLNLPINIIEMKNITPTIPNTMLSDFFNLFFPRLCVSCSNNLYKQEKIICIKCMHEIPKTNFHMIEENPVAQLFWGRVNIKNATAYYYYNKGSKFQSLIHKMKYQNLEEIGIILGQKLACELDKSPLYNNINLVVPVPLHPKKQKTRGYNQSQVIAEEIARTLKKECVSGNLYRQKFTSSQTNRSRYNRFENVTKKFDLHNPEQFSGKHILLVDDVITTGSTLEACAEVILAIPGTTVSAAVLAVA